MTDDEVGRSWRNTSNYLVDIGRCLEQIESALSHIRATGVVSDRNAAYHVDEMYRAANKLVRSIRSLRFAVYNR